MVSTPHEKPRGQQYRAYLLRIWQDESDGRIVWRASLEDARTGEKHGFADLTQLHTYLAEWTSSEPKAP